MGAISIKKLILIGSIIVSIILIIPISIANDLEMPIDNTKESSSSDEYEEIYTIIHGSCHSRVINRWGFFRNVEMYAGQVQTSMTVRGKRLNGSEWEAFTGQEVRNIKSPCYFGLFKKISDMPCRYSVVGIAFGNIEWS